MTNMNGYTYKYLIRNIVITKSAKNSISQYYILELAVFIDSFKKTKNKLFVYYEVFCFIGFCIK